ncbi:MAG TPA: DUF4175 family protein [Pirellulales bacterium]|nr:DUF4175 family protein [Pirellulales bacterium]
MSTILESQRVTRPAAVVRQLEATRTALRTYQVVAVLVRLGLIELALVAALALADWFFITGAAVRVLCLMVMAGLIVAEAIRTLAKLRRLGRGEAAVAIEENFPQLGQRVRTTLEYFEPSLSTAPASPGLVDALVTDTDRQARAIDFQTLIPWQRTWRQATALTLAVVAGLVALVVLPDARIALERLLLVPVHYTRLSVKPGDWQVKVGGEAVIQAELTGRPVRQVELRYRLIAKPRDDTEAHEWQSLPFGRSDDQENDVGHRRGARLAGEIALAGTVETRLSDLQEDLEYQVVAGQLASDIYRLTIVRPLVLKEVAATITPPAYTRRPPVVESKGNLKVIEGSRVELMFTLDRPPHSAQVALRRKSHDAEAVPPPAVRIEGAELSVELATIDQELEYELSAEAGDGMKLEPRKFRIRVAPDQKPTVRFVEPPEQLEVTITTEVAIRVEAADDFGVGKIGIVYQIADEPQAELYLEDLPQQPLTVEALATLFLERHEVNFTDAVTYYAFAEDNYPGGLSGSQGAKRFQGPNRATTELRFIDIRPYKRAYQMATSEGGPPSGESSTSLEELIARQRVNLNRSFAQLDVPQFDSETAARLAKTEQELADVTREFAAGMEQRGMPVPSLGEAAGLMQQAANELASRGLKSAVEHERAALAGLIKARRNFRKLLTQSDSQTASACRTFDTEQKQKLRPPKVDNDKAKHAHLAKDLEKLAEKEKKFSEEISPNEGGAERFPAEAQQEAAEQAGELRKRVHSDEDLTQLAKRRMDAAADAVRSSAQALATGDRERAAQEAADAAERLQQLAEQVAALKAIETPAKLTRLREMASRLANEQRELGQQIAAQCAEQEQRGVGDDSKAADGEEPGTSAGEQAASEAQLAEEARTLADVLNRLRTDAADESRELSQALTKAALANPPAEAADQMEQAAVALREGKRDEAGEQARSAADSLAALTLALEAAYRELVHAQLDKLLAAEKQAALAQAALTSVTNQARQAEAEKQLGELNETMQSLAPANGKLKQAAGELAEAVQLGAGHWEANDDDPRGAYVPPQAYLNGLRRAIEALQATIQEIVLGAAQLDRDGAVPPEYKRYVEDYYRVLSEDLR